jgi:DNA-binding TFAR19-related protein (PDSD5 family)
VYEALSSSAGGYCFFKRLFSEVLREAVTAEGGRERERERENVLREAVTAEARERTERVAVRHDSKKK